MKYSFWKEYDFIPYDEVLKFDVRLSNVISKLEKFFKESRISDYHKDEIRFFIAGSCIKADSFRDIDIFIPTQEELNKICSNINDRYHHYTNNAISYIFDNDVFQIVYRERFLNKDLDFIVDIFDFYSTKIGFECILNTKTFEINVIKSSIRKEFIDYIKTKKNGLTRVNINPFVSLQRAINFLKRGDDISFATFLMIISKIAEINRSEDSEKYLERLQGDDEKLAEVKEAIITFMNKR